MDSRRRQVEEFFLQAVELGVQERATWLDALGKANPTMAREVRELLGSDQPETPPALLSPLRGKGESSRAAEALASEVEFDRPERIGPYRLIEELGRGGMGVVYLAEQESGVRRRVAIKLVKAGMDTVEVLGRFEQERQALALLRHPNIAAVLDAGATLEGRPFFVMEAVLGPTLLHHARRLEPRARVALLEQVCRGVQHAHGRGILHRDLKPSNILVDLGGDEPVPKIIDFGVAKALDDPLVEWTPRTTTGMAVGTPEYMSPEQARGELGAVDVRSDVHALGVTLFELLTGERPFEPSSERVSRAEIIRRLLEEEARAPSSVVSSNWQAPGELDAVVLKALEKAPARRYPTVAAFREDLARWLAGQPVEAVPPSSLRRLRIFARRYRVALLVTAALFGALGVGLATTLWQAQVAKRNAFESAENLAGWRRLADLRRAEELLEESKRLWPAWPARVGRCEDWIVRAESLAARAPLHRERLLKIAVEVDDESVDVDESLWEREQIERFLAALAHLDPGQTIAPSRRSVRERLRAARHWEERIEPSIAAAWSAAIEAIAAAPAYHGLRLNPQPGLVPLGPNAERGFWEFYEAGTGEKPQWSPAGVEVREDMATIFVLLPGGTCIMGAQRNPAPGSSAPRDPHAGDQELPVHEFELTAFFLSKFELTQGQWERWSGENPSQLQPGPQRAGLHTDRRHPVEKISWHDARAFSATLGWELPSEAQWEYAARAGTRTVWSCGDELDEVLIASANFADSASQRFYTSKYDYTPDTDDGWPLTAPVGSLLPNPFGLYDIHGNVEEWCYDEEGIYLEGLVGPRQIRDVQPDRRKGTRVLRGGNFFAPARYSRCAARTFVDPTARNVLYGLRPARRVLIDPTSEAELDRLGTPR